MFPERLSQPKTDGPQPEALLGSLLPLSGMLPTFALDLEPYHLSSTARLDDELST